MSGLGERIYGAQYGNPKVTPAEIDSYHVVNTGILSISATWVGTCAGGTAGVAKPLVIINRLLDHPRNLLYSVVGTNDIGGTWTANGYDQFGNPITETVTNGTVANGTPAWAVAGTKIFSEVTSGTFTATSTTVGAGSARLGVAIGTAGTTAFKLGLLTKIAGSTDVKAITWTTQNVVTTLNGGTIGSFVDATNHAISGSSIMAGTEAYKAIVRPTAKNYNTTDMAKINT